MVVKILPNDRGETPSKLADVELWFEDGELRGLRLLGFSIWQGRRGKGLTVTFPSRSYFAYGQRRAYPLLRPIDTSDTINVMRRLILESYADFERQMATVAS